MTWLSDGDFGPIGHAVGHIRDSGRALPPGWPDAPGCWRAPAAAERLAPASSTKEGHAVAVVQDRVDEETDRSTTNYDAIHEHLVQSGPIEGFLLHTAGFTGREFRIFEVWETREHYDRFVEERLMPIIREIALSDSRQPELSV